MSTPVASQTVPTSVILFNTISCKITCFKREQFFSSFVRICKIYKLAESLRIPVVVSTIYIKMCKFASFSFHFFPNFFYALNN